MKTTEKKLTTIFGVALIILMALSSTTYAITGNYEPDAGRHPYVGLLVFDYDHDNDLLTPPVPGWRCTGSLLSSTVVLCAGHCTDGAVAARIWFQEGPIPIVDSSHPYDPGVREYPYGGDLSYEGDPNTNPRYREYIGPGNGIPVFSFRDVGIVVLTEPVPTSVVDEYAELPTAGLVDTLAVMTDVDLVGYGVQYQEKIPGNVLPSPPPYYRWTGPRCRFYAPAQLLSGEFSWSDEFLRCTANLGRGKGGTAFGDSGGPVLLGDTILAVNSYVTNINCKGTTYHSRVDIPEVLAWIQGFL